MRERDFCQSVRMCLNQEGATLIEVLISMVIMTVAISGIMAVLPQAYNHINNAGQMSIMSHVGQSTVDKLKAISFNDPLLASGWQPSQRPDFPHDSNFLIPPSYSVQWFVETNQPQAGVKTIIIEVRNQVDRYYAPTGTKPTPATYPNGVLGQKTIRFHTYVTQ